MLINTTRGELDEALLEKRTGTLDDDNELTTWVEYWFIGELVHRSVDTKLKPLASAFATSSIGDIA